MTKEEVITNYQKKYQEALEELKNCCRLDCEPASTILKLFPELEESDYIIKRKLEGLLGYFRSKGVDHGLCNRISKWLERQEEKTVWNEKQLADVFERVGLAKIVREQKNDNLLNAVQMALIELAKQTQPEDKGEISDGYHTFNELYYYRMLYNAAFFNLLPKHMVYKSKRHHDGEECFGGGWFIVVANLPTGQISNHYELKDWDLFDIPEKEIADEWDGHTTQEAAERLHKYLSEKHE